MTAEDPSIKVSVTSEYLPTHSQPEDNRYAFAYHIRIANHGLAAAQLLRRHWIIIDANQERQEVRGDGVIGEQPIIEPGGEYQYSSGVILETSVGTMQGSYQLIDDAGMPFEAPVAPFLLSTPNAVH